MEERLFQRILSHVDKTLPETVKCKMRPVMYELMQNDDSIFDASSYSLKSPHSPTTQPLRTLSFSDFNVRFTEIEESFEALKKRQESLSKLLDQHDADFPSRLKSLENTYGETVLPKINQLEYQWNSYKKDRLNIKQSFDDVHKHMNAVKASIAQNTALIYATNEKISACEELSDQICASIDGLGQYIRRESLEFHGIPDQGSRSRREDTNKIIINFCEHYLGVNINTYDISVSHRQPIAAERKRLGRKYIPPIYCRFVNRQLATQILKKKSLLKNVRNERNEPFFIKENLTLQRRLLREKARENLTSYKYQWVRNGSIFVKRDRYSRPIRIVSEAQLDELISEQNQTPRGVAINHRSSFVNALKLQKANQSNFNFDRVTPFLVNTKVPRLDSFEDFPPLSFASLNSPDGTATR